MARAQALLRIDIAARVRPADRGRPPAYRPHVRRVAHFRGGQRHQPPGGHPGRGRRRAARARAEAGAAGAVHRDNRTEAPAHRGSRGRVQAADAAARLGRRGRRAGDSARRRDTDRWCSYGAGTGATRQQRHHRHSPYLIYSAGGASM